MKKDFMHDWTDDKILEIKKSIQLMFTKARKSVIEEFEDINKKVPAYSLDADKTEILKKWNKNKLLDNFIKETAIKIKNLNKEVIGDIQDSLVEVYLQNYLYGAFLSELIIDKDVFEKLPTNSDVKEMLKENPNEFTNLKYNEITSLAFIAVTLNQVVKSAIIKNRNEFKKAFDKYLAKMVNTANTTAETNCTRIESVGRLEAFNFADKKYKGFEKQWISTLDTRTRRTHRALMLKTVPLNKKFRNGLMYPGDPKGSPSETLNCRCTISVINPRYNPTMELDKAITRKNFDKWRLNK